jgi:hypothetical protein
MDPLTFSLKGLSTPSLLTAWEEGCGQSPTRASLRWLAAAYPETSASTLARLSVGQRDACLLSLQESLFGPEIVAVTTCPKCGASLDLTFKVADIRSDPPSILCSESEEEGAVAYSIHEAGHDASFRLPNSLDIEASRVDNPEDFRRQLLARCLLDASKEGNHIEVDKLPAEVVATVAKGMELADPQANVALAFTCAGCGQAGQAVFDIVTFLKSEIEAWAMRILRDVHTLASAYGWSETDVLAMSPRRRQAYLEMVG